MLNRSDGLENILQKDLGSRKTAPFLVSRCHTGVVYSVEELRHSRQDCRLEALHVGVRELEAPAVESNSSASHEDGELTAPLQGVGEGEVGVESVRAGGGVLAQLEDGGTGGGDDVLM